MERGEFQLAATTISLQQLNLNLKSKSNINSSSSSISNLLGKSTSAAATDACFNVKPAAPSLVNLCVQLLGKHLEDLIPHLCLLAPIIPAHIKSSMAAIARRRYLLSDHVLISLADPYWDFLDISTSDVSDSALATVAQTCPCLRAVDISRCPNITAFGVHELVRHCHLLEVMRCGYCSFNFCCAQCWCLKSDLTARRCLGIFKPKLSNMEADSWEELDTNATGDGAESLRWLIWPKIDKDSLEGFSKECPRLVINPKSSPFGFRSNEVPREAFPDTVLDDPVIKDLDPKTWAVYVPMPMVISQSTAASDSLSVAEKFRLAFVERDTRLAPKRAKNARQHQRRAVKEEITSNADARAIALASKASRHLYS